MSQNFQGITSLGSNMLLMSGFINAVQSFSKEITGTNIKTMNLENFTFHFYSESKDSSIIYVIITGIDFDAEEINSTLNVIASLFYEKYSNYLKNFEGDITPFFNFGNLIIKMKALKEKYEKETGKNAFWRGKLTKGFIEWKKEKVEY